MRPKKRRQRRQDRLNQATLEDIIRENPDLFRGGNVNLLPEAEVEGTYGEVNQRRRRRRKEFIEDLPNVGKEVGFELARMAPILGDAIDVAEIRNAARTGKDFYGEEASPEALAGIAAAGLLVPNIIEKPMKRGFKALKRAFKGAPNEIPIVGPKPSKPSVPKRTPAKKSEYIHNEGGTPALSVEYKNVERKDLTRDEQIVQDHLDRIKSDMDSPEGRRRIKDMIASEANDLLQQEVDGVHITQAVHEQARRVLRDPDALDKQVEVVLEGDPFLNKGVMNADILAGGSNPRANYDPAINRINPGLVDKRTGQSAADHELAHSVQYNILESFGVQKPNKAFVPGMQVGLQKQGFRSIGSRGTEIDRQAVRGIQKSDDPSVIRRSQMPGVPKKDFETAHDSAKFHNARQSKSYFEEGFDVDFDNPNNPSEEIRYRNAVRGHRTNEAYPMMVDLRDSMMREGVLGGRYDKITPEMIEQLRTHKGFANKGTLAMTDFKDPVARKFANKRMSDLMNKMPALIPALAGAGYLRSQRGEQRQSGF